jgi:hypothetical protein
MFVLGALFSSPASLWSMVSGSFPAPVGGGGED